MTTTIQLTTGVLTGEVRDVANPATPITAGGFVTDTIPNRGPNDTILLSLEGESANSAASVVSTYGGLVFTPNAVDAPTLGTWTYYLNPTAAETIALGANPPPTTETFTITYITRDDNGSETGSYEATIVVTIAGKDDPVQSIRYVNPTDDTADISIDEDASTGDIVGEVVITDTDTEVDDSNGNSDVPAFTITAISYVDENGDTQSFTGESPFGFDEATGNIIVVGDLDYESINQYTLTITATDATDTSIVTPPVTVTINVRDVNEAPTLSASSVSGAINENVVAGTKVTGITFAAEDVDAGDNPTYHIIGGDGMSVFDIADDGTIILKDGATLDYESTKSYTLIAEARDPEGLKSDPVTVTIEIGNELEINNNVPFAPISINENDTSLSFTVTPVEAKFEDSPFPWITDPVKVGTVYSIDSGGDGLFTIDRTSGIVTLTGALDYETKEQYEVVVRADVGEEHATTTLIINVRDVNEAPTLSASSVSGTINENVVAGTKVTGITFTAEDVDVGDNPTYHIIGGDGMSVFDIADDGTIILKGSATLDYESTKSYTLIAEARDPEGLKSDPVTVTIEIGNELEINNNVPFAPISIDENETSLSFTVTPVEAKFEDSPFPWITDPVKVGTIYSIDSGGDGLFTIGRTSGVVTLTGALDYETKEQYEVVVRADVGNEYATTTLTINVRDVYEAPTISGGKIITIAENDADADLNTIFEVDGNIVTGLEEDDFTITGEHSENFRVAKNTNGEWQLELTSALDYEAVLDNAADTEADFDLQIAITDDRGNSATQTIYIIVTDDTTEITPQLGTDIGERLYGDADDNHIYGYKGNDNIRGGTGEDIIYGGKGNDLIEGWIGNDIIYGGAGDDRLFGIANAGRSINDIDGGDILYGGEGNDYLSGDQGDDRHYGGEGNDTFYDFLGDDWFFGGRGIDVIDGGDGYDIFYLDIEEVEAGNTNIIKDFVRDGWRGIDRIRVDVSGADKTAIESLTTDAMKLDKLKELADIRWATAHINAKDSRSDSQSVQNTVIYNTLGTESENDDIILMVLEDFARGLTFEMFEVAIGGTENGDTIRGSNFDDNIYSHAGNDSIYGGDGADRIEGGDGNDSIWGEGGNDIIDSGNGIDKIWGGTGDNIFYLNNKALGVNTNIVGDFSVGDNQIRVRVNDNQVTTLAELKSAANIRWEVTQKNVAGYRSTDSGSTDDAGVDNTIIYRIVGKDDSLTTNTETDDIMLMVLEDYVTPLTMDMFSLIIGASWSSRDITAGPGDDIISGNGGWSFGPTTIRGGNGNDIIKGRYAESSIYGEGGNDIIYGEVMGDFIDGGAGIDIMLGHYGDDIFSLDTSALAGNTDIVVDFREIGADLLRVDTVSGDEDTFTELGIRVDNNENKIIAGFETGENDASVMDTVIYRVVGTPDNAPNHQGPADDIMLMVLEDFTSLDISMFDVM